MRLQLRLSELPKLFPSFRTSAKPVLSPFKSGSRWKPYKIKESWTHQFVCVAEIDQESIPSKHLKCQLTNAGLAIGYLRPLQITLLFQM